MEALEFVTKIKDKQIIVPHEIQSALENNKDREIRVIVLIEEDEGDNYPQSESFIQNTVREKFLQGYADSDSIYDNIKE
jgi:hypoxanthine-guanine phosphoribosyltransferase